MDPFATSHFSNRALLQDFDSRVAHDHISFAILLTRIAEIDERKLYLPEGYPSMKAFLVHRMRLPTENAAYKRLTAARAARQYPGILVALADGRLSLRGALTLAPRLTPANSDELVAAALDKTCFELEIMLAERFPRPDMPERLDAIAAPAPSPISPLGLGPLAPGRVQATIPHQEFHGHSEEDPTRELTPPPVDTTRPRVVPLAPQRYGFQCTVDQETHELWQYVRALMSHEIPTGDMALVLKGALKLAAEQLERRKFAATARPGHTRGSSSPRHISAAVRCAVWERDSGQCSFVSDTGKRCASRRLLEFDHEVPVARGGQATVENLRLRCRVHNRHAAERAFGAEFMERKRQEARAERMRAAAARAPKGARATQRGVQRSSTSFWRARVPSASSTAT